MYNTTCEFIDLLLNIYSFISFIISFTIFFSLSACKVYIKNFYFKRRPVRLISTSLYFLPILFSCFPYTICNKKKYLKGRNVTVRDKQMPSKLLLVCKKTRRLFGHLRANIAIVDSSR